MNSLNSLFKLNDIRGVYPEELNEEAAFIIGQGLVELLNCRNVAIGYDTRLSSKPLFEALKEGITKAGANVIDLGLISTDALYYVMGVKDYDCGIMITASHNPPQYNGFKIVQRGAIILNEDNGLDKLRELVLNRQMNIKTNKEGETISLNIKEDFINHLLSFIDKEKITNLHFGIDTSNGMAGTFTKDLLSQLPVAYEIINEQLDGSFPNHVPNSYKEESWQQMRDLIKDKKLDFGVVFDGDADRITFLDDKGEYVDASAITILITNYFLKNNPHQAIVFDSVLSPLVEEAIKQLNGIPIRARIGHSFMKEAMRQNDALFGAEHTGHYYYKKHFYCDSGAITLLVMIEILSQIKKPLSLIKQEINPHAISREIDYLKTPDYLEKMKVIEEHYQKTCSLEYFDGLIIKNQDFRIHIHPANTGPFIRVNLEAINQGVLKEKEKELKNLFAQLNFQLA